VIRKIISVSTEYTLKKSVVTAKAISVRAGSLSAKCTVNRRYIRNAAGTLAGARIVGNLAGRRHISLNVSIVAVAGESISRLSKGYDRGNQGSAVVLRRIRNQ
jgi:hypothetical protein